MIPIVPHRAPTSGAISPRFITENCDSLRRDLLSVIARRWMRSATTFNYGGTVTQASSAARRTVTLSPDRNVRIVGIDVRLYSASDAVITIAVDGDDRWTGDVVAAGASTMAELTKKLSIDVNLAVDVTVIVSGGATYSHDDVEVTLIIESDRFQGTLPTVPAAPRFGAATPAQIATDVNAFLVALTSAVAADAAASLHTNLQVIRGPTDIAHSATFYSERIPDVGATLKRAKMYLVADATVAIAVRIGDPGGTLITLTGTGTGSTNIVTDSDVVAPPDNVQDNAGVNNSANDWTVGYQVTGGAGTIHSLTVVLEWE